MPYKDPEKDREYNRAYCRAYYKANKAKLLEQSRKYVAANAEKTCLYQRKYQKEHQEKARERQAKYRRTHRLLAGLRARVYNALRGGRKSARTLELLGCTIEFLWAHLEKQFAPGMTRENYGPVWHVDHILPCAKFHLQHSEEQEICFHWTNLQPLFAKENLKKGAK